MTLIAKLYENTTLLTFDTYTKFNDVIAFDVARQQCFKIMTLIAKLCEIRQFLRLTHMPS